METLTLSACAWSGAAAAALAPLAEHEPGGLDAWREDVEAARATLWAAELAGEPKGFALTRTAEARDGLEFWIIAASGGVPGAPLTPGALVAFERFAAGLGARRVIFWTRRPGLGRIAAAAGYRMHLVAEKEL